MDLISTIREFAETATRGSGYFVVSVERAGNSKTIDVTLDGDRGISIDKCGEISRAISRRVDEELGDEVGAFTIEVSSPGVDKPLKLERQYFQHIGRSLKFTDEEGIKHEGELLSVANGEITLKEHILEKGKKPQPVENNYLIDKIKDPKVVISFKR